MAKYTIRLQNICQNEWLKDHEPQSYVPQYMNLAEVGWNNDFDLNYVNPFDESREIYPSVSKLVEHALDRIFDFDFPLYDPVTKTVRKSSEDFPKAKELKTKIIMAYYMYEIGQETIALWKYHLQETLNRIMPYYNELYQSAELVGDNPLENHDITDHSNRHTNNKNKTNATTNTEGKANTRVVLQDTPTTELGDENYASNISDTTGNTTENEKANTDGTSDTFDVYDRHVHGLSNISKQDMLMKYRLNILNIDEQIIRELRNLFLLLC